jgi:hypothetical protein
MKLPSLPRLMLTHADFPHQNWDQWQDRLLSKVESGQTIDTSYLNVMPCCIHCATWICSSCWAFHRSRATRAVSQYCPRCGGTEGFFRAIRHLKPHEKLPQVPYFVPRIDVIGEGDPRYNLVQDLIEGDSATQDAAARELDRMKGDTRPEETVRELPSGLGELDRMMSQGCPAGDPCPGTGCPACCPSYDPCGEENCSFRCNPRREMPDVSKENAMGLDPEEARGWGVGHPSQDPEKVEAFVRGLTAGGGVEDPTEKAKELEDRLREAVKKKQKLDFGEGNKYPYPDGDVVVLGPGIFVNPRKEVICWEGENYYKHDAEVPARKVTDKDRELIAKNTKATIQRRDRERLKETALHIAMETLKNNGSIPGGSNPEFIGESLVKVAEKILDWLAPPQTVDLSQDTI